MCKIEILNDSKQETGFYIKNIEEKKEEGKYKAEIAASSKNALEFKDRESAKDGAKKINLKHYKII